MLRILAFLFALVLSAPAAVQLGIDVLQAQDFRPLAGKRVGLVTNQTGVNSAGTRTRLLMKKSPNVKLVALYSPEHGLDGTIGAGKYVATRTDALTGLTVHSLYGPTRKPAPEMLAGVDVLVYDMQDIGVRSYTYVSTMGKCMEACGEAGVEFMVLDRPNPLGGTRIEGPGIEDQWRSFVGQFPVPYIHGLTAGELARMSNAKGWMARRCKLTVIPMQGWHRDMTWSDTGLRWVQTSPNIPTAASVAYYAATSIIGSLDGCGLDVGIGVAPFQMLGHCQIKGSPFCSNLTACGIDGISFEPYARADFQGARLRLNAKTPANLAAVNIFLLAEANRMTRPSLLSRYKDSDNIFFKIYGSTSIRTLLERGAKPESIVASWTRGVESFRSAREPFLLY
jgi:uncharacterized protein YbbC (DUF1343 family)